MCLARLLLNPCETMNPKPDPTGKPAAEKATRKLRKGTTDTSRLFIDVDEVLRRPLSAPLTRYVE